MLSGQVRSKDVFAVCEQQLKSQGQAAASFCWD